MHIEIYQGDLAGLAADLLVLILDPRSRLFELGDELLEERVGKLAEEFSGKTLRREYAFDPAHLESVGTVVAYSTVLEDAFPLVENVKTFLSRALRLGAETGRKRVAVALNSPGGTELAGKAAEGALIGTYSFEKYRREPRKLFDEVTLVLWTQAGEAVEAQVQMDRLYGEAANYARDLVNEPADVLTPELLAEQARSMAQELSLDYEVWDAARLEEEGCIGLVRVGAGSSHPPRMFRVSWDPAKGSRDHLVLLGKGVTFDTGGISIKPGEKMHMMRGDMAGAAAVMGAIYAVGRLKPPLKVTALVVSAENTPGANAYRPGDILKYRNGKSVHVENTDAEGRLILADGLIQCGLLKATHVVDVATLTGACARALGTSFTGLMGRSRALVNAITRAGGNRGESYWKLPLPREYLELLKSDVADLNNLGGEYGGTVTAGLFLQEFVPEGLSWAHLDIASTFWKQKPWKYYNEGPSGTAVKTLVDLAVNWSEHFPA
ncbi:MAG: leucyl aminopeptidase [Armatimonadetes bacterium]|nr:leucyl aminopeptidase [Armatimonadota bacterium]